MPATALVMLLLAAAPAADAPRRPLPAGLVTTLSLGAGGEVGSESNGLAEMELTVGYEAGDLRPEVGLVLGLEPGTYAAVRPGVRLGLRDLPFFARVAVDYGDARDGWQLRWLLAGAGAEARLTGELGVFAEVDVGVPLARDFGVPLLGRAGFSLRF